MTLNSSKWVKISRNSYDVVKSSRKISIEASLTLMVFYENLTRYLTQSTINEWCWVLKLSRVLPSIPDQKQDRKINIEAPFSLMVFYENLYSVSHIDNLHCYEIVLTYFRQHVIFTTIFLHLYFSSNVLLNHSIVDIYTFGSNASLSWNDFSPSYELYIWIQDCPKDN